MKAKKALSLQNDLLQIQILPSRGGKVTSLLSIRTGEEFLLPPLRSYRRVSASAEFSEGDRGGFDECLPSVARCDRISGEAPVHDHGDLWRLPWHIDSQDGAVVLHADAVSRPLRLTRRAALQGASLMLDYELLNLSDSPVTWLWSAHPLLNVNAGDRVLLPSEIEEIRVEYSAARRFRKNSFIGWPCARSISGNVLDLSRVGERDGVTAHKLFARMGRSGWGALYRQKTRQGVVVRFSPAVLPFLGLWICLGAWPKTGAEKQYAVALEPTTSNVDSLTSAVRNGTARRLGPRERCQWRLELQLIGASMAHDFEDFCASARSGTSAPTPAVHPKIP
jgi:hypothetical protein